MNKITWRITFLLFTGFYACLAWYNFANQSQWAYDNLFTIGVILVTWVCRKILHLSPTGIILLNIGLFAHNAGMFNAYAFTYKGIEYDTIVHLINSLATAWIFFHAIRRQVEIKRKRKDRHDVKIIYLFLVMASVASLGTGVEVIEYLGFSMLGSGEGIFFTGAGDSGIKSSDPSEIGKIGESGAEYIDTMEDIITNFIGAILGALLYYYRWRHRFTW